MTKIWVVFRPNGEQYVLLKEPLEGMENWARGQEVTVIEYGKTRQVWPAVEGEKK